MSQFTLPGTYERCLAGGHYYACVRGDEECPTCTQISALREVVARLTAAHDDATRLYNALELRCNTLKRHIDAIAEALHPHKPKDGGWTYLPDQLAEMVTALKRENEALLQEKKR